MESVKQESCSLSSEDGVGTSSNHAQIIPFHDVYSILSKYMEENGGLDIPRTDAAMTRLVSALNKIGFAQVPSQQHIDDEANHKPSQGQSKSVDDSVHDDKQVARNPTTAESTSIKNDVQETAAAAANAVRTANATKLKARCDICEQKDGFRGYNLQICSVCGLAVHERCYGMALTTTKNLDFVCKACAAIDAKVEVNKPSILGRSSSTKETIKVQERPTECVLCNVHDGIHAMHPLFDTHGPEGRQLVISEGGNADRKLAWVHTLCANFICSKTGGSVYGCYGDDGRYEDDSDEEYTDEENEVRFYAIATKENGKETAWSKIIAEYRKTIKCTICGKRDNSGNSLGIALQCCANDVNEVVDFKRRHSDRSECFVGMHVGCARWKGDPPTVYGRECKLCYFFDGDDDGLHDDPQLACYCRKHAEDIIANNPKYRQGYNSPSRQAKKVAKKTNPPVAVRKRQGMSKSESFKRGVTMIRKGGKVEKKRKFGAHESPLKRPRVDDDGSKESSTVFYVQGRSSKILSQSIPAGLKRSMELEDDNQRQHKRFKSEEH